MSAHINNNNNKKNAKASKGVETEAISFIKQKELLNAWTLS